MTRVKFVPILQTAKVMGALGFMLGAVVSCLGLILLMVMPTESPVVILTALVGCPVGAGLLGFAGAALTCWLYNQIAQWMGGIQIDIEQEAIASQPQSEEQFAETATATPFDAAAQFESRSISVYRLRPNPQGKNRYRDGAPSADLLGGEWVDIKNTGLGSVSLKGIGLYHMAYLNPNGKPDFQLVVHLPDCSLKSGDVLRLHAGQPRDLTVLRAEDRTGANWHCFLGEDACVWNIHEGDTATLYDGAKKETLDAASYDPDPPEGVVFERQADKLVPAGVAAKAHAR